MQARIDWPSQWGERNNADVSGTAMSPKRYRAKADVPRTEAVGGTQKVTQT